MRRTIFTPALDKATPALKAVKGWGRGSVRTLVKPPNPPNRLCFDFQPSVSALERGFGVNLPARMQIGVTDIPGVGSFRIRRAMCFRPGVDVGSFQPMPDLHRLAGYRTLVRPSPR
jgi:hypothetical protein